MYPRRCLVAFVSAGSKKCTRDVSEVTAVLIGSKKYTRDVGVVTAVFMGSKKYTRNNVGCYLCLWVQKNAPADRVEWLCVKCCHALLLAA